MVWAPEGGPSAMYLLLAGGALQPQEGDGQAVRLGQGQHLQAVRQAQVQAAVAQRREEDALRWIELQSGEQLLVMRTVAGAAGTHGGRAGACGAHGLSCR